MRTRYRVRAAANLVNGSTAAGVLVALAGRARLRAAGDGLLVAAGYRLPVPVAPAFCLGNVLVTRWPDQQFRRNRRLLRHEARHATQYAWCGGLAMLPLYGAAALASWVLTGDFGARNGFEQQAGLADGGYSPKPLRPLWRDRGRELAGGACSTGVYCSPARTGRAATRWKAGPRSATGRPGRR